MALTLVIGNKTYSSWSMRPWLALAHHGIPFDEVVIPLDQPDTRQRIRAYSPTGKVPILIDGPRKVWESIGILAYLDERFPDTGLFPRDPEASALAWSISSEMHAGFVALRQHCPMNLRRRKARPLNASATADVERVTEIWRTARARYGADGDFLFGAFGAADCMFAPVATRIVSYEIPVDAVSQAYLDAIYHLPAFRAWQEAARREPWAYPATDDIDRQG